MMQRIQICRLACVRLVRFSSNDLDIKRKQDVDDEEENKKKRNEADDHQVVQSEDWD